MSACQKLKEGRAPGPERMSAEAVKIVVTIYLEVVLEIMNDILVRQEVLRCLKMGKISLVWKGKELDSASDFRPICLLNIMSKVFERIVKTRLEADIKDRDRLSLKQFGFIKGVSTTHAVKTVVKNVTSAKAWVALTAPERV